MFFLSLVNTVRGYNFYDFNKTNTNNDTKPIIALKYTFAFLYWGVSFLYLLLVDFGVRSDIWGIHT